MRSPHQGRAGIAVYKYFRTMVPVIIVWQLAAMAVPNPVILPSPIAVAGALGNLISSGELPRFAAISLRRLAIGYSLAIVIGIPLGLLIGLSRIARQLFDPVIEMFRPISGIAWIPLALMLFGIGDTLAPFILFYGAVFPILLNTASGAMLVDRRLLQAARTFGASWPTMLTQVIIPGALPTIIVGARLGLGLAWMSLIAAELVGAPNGLGFAIDYYRQLLMTPKMVAMIVTLAALGYLSDQALRYLGRVLTPWSVGLRVGAER